VSQVYLSTYNVLTSVLGKQGGSVISNLLATRPDLDFRIIAVTRDLKSRSAQKLASDPDITVIQGDFSNVSAIFAQAGPVWGVYSVQTNNPLEEQQGKALIDAAVAAGVQHFVYSSCDRGGPEKSDVDPTNVKNFAAKFNIEKYLVNSASISPQGMTYTILRPVSFFENLSADMHGAGFARMWEQMGTKKLQFVSTKDIGWFGANSFLHLDEHRNVAISLVGDELTQPEADIIFKEVTGSPMKMAPCPLGSLLKWTMKETVGDMFDWFENVGFGGNPAECREKYAAMQDFRTWLLKTSPYASTT
jgi:uncharacterized protein YbjT (DUF2867 family)